MGKLKFVVQIGQFLLDKVWWKMPKCDIFCDFGTLCRKNIFVHLLWMESSLNWIPSLLNNFKMESLQNGIFCECKIKWTKKFCFDYKTRKLYQATHIYILSLSFLGRLLYLQVADNCWTQQCVTPKQKEKKKVWRNESRDGTRTLLYLLGQFL